MRKRFILALAVALCACAPAPVRMPAAQASEVLNLFAAGRGPANVCSANGRALLRGAVRAYSREMQISGIAWPAVPGVAEQVTHVDVSVMIALAAGFVRTEDFRGAPVMNHLALAQWPGIESMRSAARGACEEVATLQQAAAALLVERARMQVLVELANVSSAERERVRRQSALVERAQHRMDASVATVQARMEQRAL
jgi:hypothetical protein